LEIVLHNGLDTEVYDLRPADYTTTTTTADTKGVPVFTASAHWRDALPHMAHTPYMN